MSTNYIGITEDGNYQILNEDLQELKKNTEINNAQLRYLQQLQSNIQNIIPLDKKNRYCLLFGKQIISDFETWEEAQREAYKLPIQVAIYKPH